MSRQLYPILLSITVALAIGVYMQPSEARKLIQQAGQWGRQLVADAVQAADALAQEPNGSAAPSGYASTIPRTAPPADAPAWARDPQWVYNADGSGGSNGQNMANQVQSPPVTSPPGYVPATLASDPRVLARASGIAPPPPTGRPPVANSPYVNQDPNPLRPAMPREAPWTTPSRDMTAQAPAATGPRGGPQVGSTYPRVDWAGDWRDYQGVPEAVKPVNQANHGYLPPPEVASTTAAVQQYLPNQQQQTLPQPATSANAWPQAQAQSLPPRQPVTPPVTDYSSVGQFAAPPLGPSATGYPAGHHARIETRQAMPPVQQSMPPMQPSVPVAPPADLTLCEGAQILAHVGPELVLTSEVYPVVNERLSQTKGIENYTKKEVEAKRQELFIEALREKIELKLLLVDAKRNLPDEAITKTSEQFGKHFEEKEVPRRLKAYKLGSRRELEKQLKEWGTSLQHEKRAFVEMVVAQVWIREKLRGGENADVTHEELLAYFQEHVTDYDHPTRLRWEHLEITFAKHADRREAWQLIATMGNAVQQGYPLAQVARDRSEGVTASDGGQRGWLTRGSLKSDVLDKALFSLPVGSLSPIIEDDTGYHIVRVVERENAYRTPFEDLQGEIREKLAEEAKQGRLQKFIVGLREEIPISTVFDKQTADAGGGAMPRY